MKKHIMVGLLLCGAVTVSATQLTHALVGTADIAQAAEKTADNASSHVLSATDATEKSRQELDAKRKVIEDKIASKKAAIGEKLTGKRQEQCEKKEATINSILDTRASAAQQHFDKFKAIQDKLAAFVAEKSLNVENAKPLEIIMTDAAMEAEVAVTAVNGLDFACEETAASSPGAIVMEEVATAKQALKDYRTAIKDYAVAVKAAATSEPTATEPTETETAQ